MFLQQLVNGLTLGAVYALIAVGYTMVYGIIELINFAHGEMYMLGAFFTMTLCVSMGWPLTVSALAGILATTIVGVVVEFIAYRPLRDSSRLTALISALGMSLFLQNLAQRIWGAQRVPFLPAEHMALFNRVFETPAIPLLGKATIGATNLVVIGSSLLLMIGLSMLVAKTSMGRAMRCCAQDKTAAKLMGVNVNRTISMTFALGSAMGAVAGILTGMHFNQIHPMMGSIAGMKAFAAAVLGGIGNLRGAYLGGILLGLLEGFSAAYIDSVWMDGIAFFVLIVVIVYRPRGLLGEALPDRA